MDLPTGRRAGQVLSTLGQLARPRLLAMVLLTLVVAHVVAGDEWPRWGSVAQATFGSALLIVGAMALNQRLEGRSDGLMVRTAGRPLPAGLLSSRSVTLFGLTASLSGLFYLGVFVRFDALLVGVVSWLLYVWIYTPLKALTPWQTPVGAVAGAMPVLLGAAAAGHVASPIALSLFGIVFFWQFPHAMAIAWLYRGQLAEAQTKVASVVDPSGWLPAVVAVGGSLALLPVSLMPVWIGQAGWLYGLAALTLGLLYLAASFRFLWCRDEGRARQLLKASFLYLPVLAIALLATVRL